MSQELIKLEDFKINAVPAVVSGNFDAMRTVITDIVASRTVLVTPETIPDCKSLIAEFRKTGKALMIAWKERRAETIADVLKADDEVKALCKLLEDGAQEMADQVKVFEDETKEICRKLLIEERGRLWVEMKVEDGFYRADLSDLIKLGSLNAKRDDLTKAAKKAVYDLVAADLALQTRTKARLTYLENVCLKNDITPLTRASVEQVLFAGDEFFNSHVDNLIAAELNRKAESEERMRKKLEAEKQAEINVALKAQQDEANRIAKEQAEAERKAEEEKLARLKQANAIYPDKDTQAAIDALVKEHQPKEEPKAIDLSKEAYYDATVVLEFKAIPNENVPERITNYLSKKLAALKVKSITVIKK